MTISIIIPTLNEEDNLPILLNHLFEYRNSDVLEIIVVDAKSTDQTKTKVSSFNIIWKESNQKSRAIQMNIGAKTAHGDILYFVHADTIPPITFSTDILNAVKEGFDLGGYRFKFQSKKKILTLNSWFTKFNKLTFRGGDQTLFITKECFIKLGTYQEEFSIMEEYALLVKADKSGYRFKLIPDNVLVSDRKYDNNSYIRVNIANLIAMTMFKKGCEPEQIKKIYFQILKHPKSESK